MPLYAYRCRKCKGVSEELAAVDHAPDSIECQHCRSHETHRIIGTAAHLMSDERKTAKLDSRYDAMVDRAMRNTRNADPNRFLRHLKGPPRR